MSKCEVYSSHFWSRTPITCTRIHDHVPLAARKRILSHWRGFSAFRSFLNFENWTIIKEAMVKNVSEGQFLTDCGDVVGADLCVTPNLCPPDFGQWVSLLITDKHTGSVKLSLIHDWDWILNVRPLHRPQEGLFSFVNSSSSERVTSAFFTVFSPDSEPVWLHRTPVRGPYGIWPG